MYVLIDQWLMMLSKRILDALCGEKYGFEILLENEP